jgi:release factor glutamine methyltransferase
VARVLTDVERRLKAAGIGPARAEAELILAHVLDVPRGRLRLAPDVSESVGDRVEALVRGREQRRPLQHLLGRAPYRHLEVAVGPGVFVPRPETEMLLDLAADALSAARVVVDLCAGSGAVSLAVAQEFGPDVVVAAECAEPALAWLRRNAAERADAGDRPVRIEAVDATSDQALADLTGTVDVVLSNPPYVPLRVRPSLPPEVLQDPAEAVFGGTDGLSVIPGVVRTAARLARPGGRLLFEHDETQADAVRALLAGSGEWREVRTHHDLTGVPRFTDAIRT